MHWPLRIYYDRSCPLCAQEMHALKASDKLDRLQLADCSAPGFHDADAEQAGVSVATMKTIIHARDAAGTWFKGVDVFVLAYDAIGLDAIARMWSHPWLRPFWNWIYPWFARNRMTLSRFGTARIYGWLIERAARKAALRSNGCEDNVCERPIAIDSTPRP